MAIVRSRCYVLILILLGCAAASIRAQVATKPLTDRKLISLVAGNALSENIVHEIASRGLAFRPTEEYRALLTTAGADTAVLQALNGAKTADSAQNTAPPTGDKLLQDLATAGKLIRAKQYNEADAALRDGLALQFDGGSESGFVMGESLRQQENWPAAEAIYREILQRDPDFPQVHTKLSYILYRVGDQEEALREAEAELAQYPDNAEAHTNAGLALASSEKYAASELEYNKALRIKPDYAVVHGDMGLVFDYQGKLDQAIVEYKKAIALDPNEADYHTNLGVAYNAKGDLDSAIREDHEAKRLNPTNLLVRQNLGADLIDNRNYADAVVEFRELEAMAPNSAICHDCLAGALYGTFNFDGAVDEYNKALALDPSDARAHRGLGQVRFQQKNYDGALQEYRLAEQLDPTSAIAHKGAGQALLARNDVPGALTEFKNAEMFGPGDAEVHDLYAQALDKSGNRAAAIAEFRQSLALEPKQTQTQLRLAGVLEKNQDWAEALDQYRQAASADPTGGARNQYKAAQDRINSVIASMQSSGGSAQAEKIKASLRTMRTEPGISEKLDLALQTGNDALRAGRLDEAESSYKEAVDLAGKTQPHDDRLTTSLMALANVDGGKKDYIHVEANLQQALKSAADLHGADSPMTTMPLQMLGLFAMTRHDYDSALDFMERAVAINEKTFGDASDRVADSLRVQSNVYVEQKAYDKAEFVLLRAVRIDDVLLKNGSGSPMDAAPLWSLCSLYDKWGKPDKAEPCDERMLALIEKQYGADSPALLVTLGSQAQALRALGKPDEAAKVELRIQTIKAAETRPN